MASIIVLSGCRLLQQDVRVYSHSPAPVAGVPVRAAEETVYRLGPRDQIRLIVFGEEDLSGEFEVDSTGVLSLPLIGQITASGLSVRDVERDVTAALNAYLVDPRVSMELIKTRPFYILGEVTTGGEYPYAVGLHVLKAISIAGGFTERASRTKVFITREGDSVEQVYPIAITTKLLPGDVVRVPERAF